ncbi:MAG TPA: hypothetical protein VMZ26_10270, partial [Pyrinomonadaceae bacterium]|nr:hypothetical protein [Pyrinomonadaceae bacterium]
MESDDDQILEPEWLRNLPVRSEDIGFSPEELVECGACGKANGPNRPACLYCGTTLEHGGITRYEIHEPEDWESGFNVVVIGTREADLDRVAAHVGSLLRTGREVVTSILVAGVPLPLARVESEVQALGIVDGLAEMGVRAMVVADDSLHSTSPPTRLRSIAFEGDTLAL